MTDLRFHQSPLPEHDDDYIAEDNPQGQQYNQRSYNMRPES